MPKPNPRPGEVWSIDLGMVGKIRPCLILTDQPSDDELDMVTVVLHTTALRGHRWEVQVPKPFLRDGAFHAQQVHSAPMLRLLRKLGDLTPAELNLVLDKVAERLGL